MSELAKQSPTQQPPATQVRVLASSQHDMSPAVQGAFERLGGRTTVTVAKRRPHWGLDWRLTGIRSQWHHLRDALRTVLLAAHYDALVLMDVGAGDALAVESLMWLLPVKAVLIIVNFMPTGPGRPHRLSFWASRRTSRWGVVRRGDIESFRREWGVDPERCRFVPYPASPVEADEDEQATKEELDRIEVIGDRDQHDYVYAAGKAYRDWDMLIAALERVRCRAVLSIPDGWTSPTGQAPSERISIIGPVSPAAGRSLARGAAVVAVPLLDTMRAAGPMVLVDAMAMGKAVVATDMNGTRDYVRHGETGLLVPPGDVDAMADALRLLLDDPDLRRKLGAAARQAALEQFMPADYAAHVQELVLDAIAARR